MKYACIGRAAQPAAGPRPSWSPVRTPSTAISDTPKEVLPRVYQNLVRDFYCGCPHQDKRIDLQACGYERANMRRAQQLEWEHGAGLDAGPSAPVLATARQRQAGRAQALQPDRPSFARRGDLVNLVPSVGEVNGDRQNFRYAVWADRPAPMYGPVRNHRGLQDPPHTAA